MKTIAVVSVGRSDFGILLPVLRRILGESTLRLHLIVSGMHTSQEFGTTIECVRSSGIEIGDIVEMLLASDSPEAIAKSMGLGTIGFAQVFARVRPDLLLLVGDRFEMHAAAVAALPFKLPIAHIHGGELTEGAIDDALRHSITKMSHLHFPSTEAYGKRIIQLGEAPWRVKVSGAPSLDNIRQISLLTRGEFAERFGIELPSKFVLVTYHPASLQVEQPEAQFSELLAALEHVEVGVLFTAANADTGGRTINSMVAAFSEKHPRAKSAHNLGTQGYFSAMSFASAMIGNSSSGIIEAGAFQLPVVDIGPRQRGRLRGSNVIHCEANWRDILNAVQRALSPAFRTAFIGVENPYGNGGAAEIIVETLKDTDLTPALVRKEFFDISSLPAA